MGDFLTILGFTFAAGAGISLGLLVGVLVFAVAAAAAERAGWIE